MHPRLADFEFAQRRDEFPLGRAAVADDLPAAAFGLGSLATLMLLKRHLPRLPSVPAVVALATALAAATGFAAGGGPVVGDIPKGLPAFSLPPSGPDIAISLLPAAFIIALMSFMEAASSAKLISGRTRAAWNQDSAPLDELHRQNMSGQSGAVLQGWAMIGEAMGDGICAAADWMSNASEDFTESIKWWSAEGRSGGG